jgi:integrase/recombinase XerD
MERWIDSYMNYITVERGLSENTLDSYGGDLVRYQSFLRESGIVEIEETSKLEVMAYLLSLRKRALSDKTVARSIAVLRGFYRWLADEGVLRANPLEDMESPKTTRSLPDALSVDEVDSLLNQPDPSNPIGMREEDCSHGPRGAPLATGVSGRIPPEAPRKQPEYPCLREPMGERNDPAGFLEDH